MSETQFPSAGSIPVGFRFNPTDEELVNHYLEKTIKGETDFPLIEDMDVYAHEPWLLPHKNRPMFKDNEWYYFVKRERASGKNGNGKRPRRTITGDINGGKWKATDGDKKIISKNGQHVGFKRSLTFYANKKKSSGEGKVEIKTDWIMKEYTLVSDYFQERVICRIRYKPQENTIGFDNPSPAMTEEKTHSDITNSEGILKDGNFSCTGQGLAGDVGVSSIGDHMNSFSDFYSGVLGDGENTALDRDDQEFADYLNSMLMEGLEVYCDVSDQRLLSETPNLSGTEDPCCGVSGQDGGGLTTESAHIAANDTEGFTFDEIDEWFNF